MLLAERPGPDALDEFAGSYPLRFERTPSVGQPSADVHADVGAEAEAGQDGD